MSLVDIDNGRRNWPKYTLLFHAIELALKAAIVLYGERGVPKRSGPEPANHDLNALYDDAAAYGLIKTAGNCWNDLRTYGAARHPLAQYPPVPVQAGGADLPNTMTSPSKS